MRFVRLVADHFCGIEHAEVEFGPGLNILYGPNDLGKSSLAAAIRAVLLLPHGSSEADKFMPWRGDFSPEVNLTFADADDRLWRVTKSFGGNRGGSSFLESSKDGRDFLNETKGREVDERLRKVLEWGAAPAGARAGAPRGLPQTFLSHVLLAEQTDVAAILEESLEMDSDPGESGRLRLTRALQGLARDPRFKKLLDQAEAECDQHFSPTGKLKRGKSSPMTKAAEQVTRLRDDLNALNEQLRATEEVESRLRVLRESVGDLSERRHDADERRSQVRRLAAAQHALDEAREALRRIEEERARVEAKEQKVAALVTTAAAQEASLTEARDAEDAARFAFAAAKEAHAEATSERAASQRALKVARLEQALAATEVRRGDLVARQKAAEHACSCAAAVTMLEAQNEEIEGKAVAARTRLSTTDEALADARAQREQFQDLLAYGRLSEAAEALRTLLQAREEAAELKAKAEGASQEAAQLRAAVAARPLPEAGTIKALHKLHGELERAEAALGGGLSATLSLRKSGVEVEVRVDGGQPSRAGADLTVNASRSIELSIEDVAEVRVVAGDAGNRRRAEALRQRWKAEAQPVLTLAGHDSVAALADARAQADGTLRQAEQLDKNSRHDLEKASALESRSTAIPRHEIRVRELEAALEGRDRLALATIVKTVGPGWESQTEKAAKDLDRAESRARADRDAASGELAGLGGQITQITISLAAAREESERARAALEGDPEALLAAVVAEMAVLDVEADGIKAELLALRGAVSDAVSVAKSRMHAAEQALSTAIDATKAADAAATQRRSKRDQARGELEAQKKHAESLPRRQAEEDVRLQEATLAALGAPDPPTSEADVKAAEEAVSTVEAELTEKKGELHQVEGELLRIGGKVARDRHAPLQAALDEVLDRQRALELDAESWKLLRDTLKDCEASGAQHLGRALGGDVARRFGELTQGRYGDLDMNPHLRVQHIAAGGGQRAVDVLSVGTRDQLATLLRLAIAERIGSAIILDDQLVQSDPARLDWFRMALNQAAALVQVIVLTCRREDYVSSPAGDSGTITRVNLAEKIRRAG